MVVHNIRLIILINKLIIVNNNNSKALLYIVNKTVKKEIERWPTLDFWRKSGINLLKTQKVMLFNIRHKITLMSAVSDFSALN